MKIRTNVRAGYTDRCGGSSRCGGTGRCGGSDLYQLEADYQ